MHIDFQNITPLQKSKNKTFLAVANLADSQIKAWLGNNNLFMDLRGTCPYNFTQKSM